MLVRRRVQHATALHLRRVILLEEHDLKKKYGHSKYIHTVGFNRVVLFQELLRA